MDHSVESRTSNKLVLGFQQNNADTVYIKTEHLLLLLNHSNPYNVIQKY